MNNKKFYVLILFTFFFLIANSVQADISDKEKKAAVGAVAVAASKASENKDKKTDNKALKLATISVTGVDNELKKNIELHMPVTVPECKAERAEVAQFFNTVKKHVRKASRALGYYDAELRSGGKIENNCWKLRLRIKPGKPVKVVSQKYGVTGTGKDEAEFKEILSEYPYEKGEPLNHKKYADFKTKLSDAAQALGYFDAEFEKHAITVSPTLFQAKIHLVLNTGTRYRYGKVTVDQDILAERKIKNYIVLKPGQPYNTEDLINQQQILQRSGYYKLIKVDALLQKAADNQVPIEITLTSKKRNAYTFKVGYGSDTGGRVSAEMNRRWTGNKGRKLKLAAQYSEKLSGVTAQLISPRKNPDDDNLIYTIKWEQDTNDDLVSKSIEIGGLLTTKRSNDWIQTASITLLLDETQVENEDANKSNLLLFGVGLEKTKLNSLLFPTDGWLVKLEAKGAVEKILSDQSVFQLKATGKKLKKIGKGSVLGRLSLGTTIVDNFDDLPKSLRFFAGGGNSVRGYSFEGLGNVNSEGSVIGGKQLLTAGLEYQHPVVKDWSAVAFVDAGNAFSNWSDPDLKIGYGFGARWRSPVGAVRIDIGFPEDDFSNPHLYLNVGSGL